MERKQERPGHGARRSYGNRLLRALMGVMLISLLAVLILSMLLFSNAMRREIALARSSLLERTAQSFVANIKSIEQSALEKSIDPAFSSRVENSRKLGMREIEPLVSQLREYQNEHRGIASAALYLRDGGYVVTSNDGFWLAGEYYDQEALGLCDGSERTSWSGMRTITDNTGLESQVLTFAIRMPGEGQAGEGYIIVSLSGSILAAGLQPWEPAEGEDTLLLDSGGRVICSSSGEQLGQSIQPGGAGRTLATTTTSQYNGWTFLNTVPTGYIMRPLFEMALVALLAAVLFGVVGTLVVRRLSVGIYRPIAEITDELRSHVSAPGEDTDSEYLRQSVLQVLQQNKALVQAAEAAAADSRQGLLYRWLTGRLPRGKGVAEALAELGLPAAGQYGVVLCAVDHASLAASPYGPEVDSLLLFAVENVMDELLGAAVPSACCWMENDRLAFVAAVEDYDGFLDLLAASRDTAGQALHLTLTLTASQLADSPESIPFCWDSCLELLNHRLELGSGLITEADVQRGDEGSPMLLSQQLREVLTANAENGNTAGFAAGVDKLVAEAKAKPLASPEIAYAAFMSILSILITALNNRGWKAGEVFGLDVHPYQAVTAMETLDEMGAYVKQLQAASVGYLGEEKQTKNKKLLEHVTRYIQENYHQPLQLATVAEHVYLSPSYLSRLFRQEVGKTFLEYLTEVRIEKSKELLRQPELRLADIAERTQFGTANNFIKVFKKHQGITPGQYRGKLAASTLGAGGEGGVACEEG